MQKSKEADSTDTESCVEAPKELVVFDDSVGASAEPDDYTKQFNSVKLNDYRQDIKLRKHFSWATYGLLCAWLLIVAGLLIWSSRSDEVLIALISGATVQVIGLYYIVLRYIFPSRGGNGENGS
ncbi:MAG: hypothetical protein H5U19_09125 [Rhodobacteraceae bacterium]|nr:hypothetical protein [Paracoccaceae bacterium]